jgi:small redox-active disulfide protein 2
MIDVKVLGTGCANCRTTVARVEEVARAAGVAIRLTKVEELPEIMGYGILSTPGVVVDGRVVHAGGVPSREMIASWLVAAPKPAAAAACAPGSGCCCEGRR